MNWVQPKFTDFALPPNKKQKLGESQSEKSSLREFCSQGKLNWKPRVKSDLVVNKKKIEEVESWLVAVKKRGGASVLLLSGPPGCGKLTTLKVLCSELKINLVEWLPQVAQRKYDPENGEYYQSLGSLFEEFVSRATRYTNVLNSMSSRLIVVKDVPNCYVRDPRTFHEFLMKYTCVPGVHLAFILTDGGLAKSLFPDILDPRVNLTKVSFNPITLRGLKDALRRIFPGSRFIDVVASSSNGDLRHAVAAHAFAAQNGSAPAPSKKKTADDASEKSDFIDIFRGLGRVLYGKRDDLGRLVHNPLEVAESFFTSPDLFLGMLHENYLHTFSSVHDVAKSSATLSMSDNLLNDFKDSSNSRYLSLAVASSSIMINNTAPVKKFLQLNKPKKIIVEHLSQFKARFSDSNVLLDMATYGRSIPSFASENREMFNCIKELK